VAEYNLSHPKRKSIFKQFLYSKKLRFNEIEKLTGMRSNELAYFVNKLVEEGILLKHDDTYLLSQQAEKYIPFFVSTDDELSPLPVVLVACVKDGKILLWKRSKRPYENNWCLPGGRLRLKETIAQASVRILKKVTFTDGKFESLNSIVNEKNNEDGEVKHAFLILFTKTIPLNSISEKDDVKWFRIGRLPAKMIPSDRWLVANKLEDKMDIKEETIKSKGDCLEMQESNL
jgi:ADP-ribose pyrophosphatase YjhB (NUDIX family)